MELPNILAITREGEDSLVLTLDIQADLTCFQGHFDLAPVLAGVVQIDWVIRLAREHFAPALVFRNLQSIKFLRLVRPPVTITLTMNYLPGRGLVKFSYRAGEVTYSTGAIGIEVSGEPR